MTGSGSVTVRTTVLDANRADLRFDLLSLLPPEGGLAWIHGVDGHQEGFVGLGEAARMEFEGRERFSRAQRWWSRWCGSADVHDGQRVMGSGPVAFSSFGFDDEPGHSVVVVPQVLIGRLRGRTFVTIASVNGDADHIDPYDVVKPAPRGPFGEDDGPSHVFVTWSEGSRPVIEWQSSVTNAVERISRGELDKVVLARDVVATTDRGIDIRWLLRRLNSRFPDTWVFSVDGLVGATPELLVRREGDSVTSRVLAGTVRRSSDDERDGELARELMGSDKDQEEHSYAVSSVAAALAAHCTDLDVPDEPQILRLANVQHLATDVRGRLADDVPALALAASLHPTAAVCGTPTERAFALIREIEGMARGRYAAPVGWIDSRGDGELGIALRCAHIEDAERTTLRLFAGCGLVAGSDAERELAESQSKLVAMRDAIEPR
jgi:menaquinone-specific isochorismate synthase